MAYFSLVLFFILASPLAAKVLFFHLPSYSSTFDCDDDALLMEQRFSQIGIRTEIIAGNTKLSGERWNQLGHVWLLVKIGPVKIPFDWGLPALDKQHYEGYI